MNPRNLFAELKRRNVCKVAVAYAVVAWLVIQIATQVFPFFEIPNWAVRLVVLAIIIGFPIALVIAWAFELTPEGLKRTEDVDLATQLRRKSRAWVYIVIVGALLSVGLFRLGRYGFRERNQLSNELPAKFYLVSYLDLREGKIESARAHFLASDEPFRLTGTAMVEHTLIHASESDQALDTLKTKYTAGSAFPIAAVYARCGEKDRAFGWLDRANDQHDSGMPRLRYDPTLATLHDDRRFAALVKKIGFSEANP
jgi:hypothetical protein